jgi:phosphatidate cytidylyltransferase
MSIADVIAGSAACSVPSKEPAAAVQGGQARPLHDIGARVASALVLIPIGLGAAWFGGPWMAGACGAAAVIMSYEWTRMSEPQTLNAAFPLCLTGVFGAVLLTSWGRLEWAFGWLALWAALSSMRRRSAVGVVETFCGVLYVGTPCALFLALRAHEPGGREAILGLFSIIWTTDAAAYFGGTLIGGPRVSRRLSPQKTWAGLIAGTLAGAAGGTAFALLISGPPAPWAMAGAALGAVGLFGDLFESGLKRRFNVKDASGLIPGHGGFLDRLDGLMFATAASSLALWFAPDLMPRLLGR